MLYSQLIALPASSRQGEKVQIYVDQYIPLHLLLIEPKSKHSWGDRSFVVAAPRLWNELPLSIRTSPSLEVFKKNLKTYLMLQAYVDV